MLVKDIAFCTISEACSNEVALINGGSRVGLSRQLPLHLVFVVVVFVVLIRPHSIAQPNPALRSGHCIGNCD